MLTRPRLASSITWSYWGRSGVFTYPSEYTMSDLRPRNPSSAASAWASAVRPAEARSFACS
jgi:hypothetical protein